MIDLNNCDKTFANYIYISMLNSAVSLKFGNFKRHRIKLFKTKFVLTKSKYKKNISVN